MAQKKIGERRPPAPTQRAARRRVERKEDITESAEYMKSVCCKSLSAHHFTQPAAHNVEKTELTAARVFLSPSGVENDETLPTKNKK